MRDAFVESLLQLALANEDVVLLTADLGFKIFDEFEATCPRQFYNTGITEQAMMGIASGLALEGYSVFTYSIGNFPSLRCLEQLRNDACYHELNVNIVASGGGFSYGQLGMSHHATEDLAIMRALPNTTIVAPSTAAEASAAVPALYREQGVGYLRIDKTVAPDDESLPDFEIGLWRVFRRGERVALLCVGGIMIEALEAAEVLLPEVSVTVVSCHSIKPFDQQLLQDLAKTHDSFITVEEHSIIGGLGGLVAEFALENGIRMRRFKRIGLKDTFSSIVGSPEYLRKHYSMDATAIVHTVREML